MGVPLGEQEAEAFLVSVPLVVILHTRADNEPTILHTSVPAAHEYDVEAAPRSFRHPQAGATPRLNWDDPEGQLNEAARDSTHIFSRNVALHAVQHAEDDLTCICSKPANFPSSEG